MKMESSRVLDRLCNEQPCLAAVFSTYSFSPAFFEDHVLRAILQLSSDPVEQPQRYYSEALRALQETPVAVVVDAGQRQPGRRLPYDVLEVNHLVFHPKSALLLFEDHARLMVGSGNLTFPGYSQNTELFMTLDLRYDSDSDVAILQQFDRHLLRIEALTQQRGSQLSLIREELNRRIGREVEFDASPGFALLDSTVGSIADQVLVLLPETSKINYIGMLAPFYERDDFGELDANSVFGVMQPRVANEICLDVGLRWENAQVQSDAALAELQDGIDQLWAWTHGDGDHREIEYIVLTAIRGTRIEYLDHCGASRRWELDAAMEAVEEGDLWILPKPIAFAPKQALKAAEEVYSEVNICLHPSTRLVSGRPVHRPLHAKLLLIGYRQGRSSRTLVVIGSPNMSRRALLQKAGEGAGNVEFGIAFVLDKEVKLNDFLPELVRVPAALLKLQEHDFPESGTNWALAIDQVAHDPSAKTLVITWSERAKELSEWSLLYQGRILAKSDLPPDSKVVTNEFVLQPSTAEVVLRVEGQDFSVPILITDLVALPVVTTGGGLGFRDLLMLLGRRIGREKAIEIAGRTPNGQTDGTDDLDRHFGESFNPTDVFRAWWSVAKDLEDKDLSVLAFRLRLEGGLGVGDAWKYIYEAAESGKMNVTEAWFYGEELLREIDQVDLPESPDRDAKFKVLNRFVGRVRTELNQIAPQDASSDWIATVRSFYGGTN